MSSESKEITTSEFVVLRTWVKNEQADGWKYFRLIRGTSDFSHTTNVREAMQFDLNDPQEIVKCYDWVAQGMRPSQPLELVRVSVTSEVEQIGMENEAILEERRRVALSKLNRQDIEALGVSHLASYSKLKYHGGKNV